MPQNPNLNIICNFFNKHPLQVQNNVCQLQFEMDLYHRHHTGLYTSPRTNPMSVHVLIQPPTATFTKINTHMKSKDPKPQNKNPSQC